MYAGTMGRKQGLEILAEAAGRLSGREGLRFVFCGEGPGKLILSDLTAHLANVQWIPLQPCARLNDLLNLADIHLLPQKADAADLVMPSKLTGMLASGRPVVATSRPGTQLAEAVEGRGIAVEPADTTAFARAIEQLADDCWFAGEAWEEMPGNMRFLNCRKRASCPVWSRSCWFSRPHHDPHQPTVPASFFRRIGESAFHQAIKRLIDVLGSGLASGRAFSTLSRSCHYRQIQFARPRILPLESCGAGGQAIPQLQIQVHGQQCR